MKRSDLTSSAKYDSNTVEPSLVGWFFKAESTWKTSCLKILGVVCVVSLSYLINYYNRMFSGTAFESCQLHAFDLMYCL